MVSIYSTSKTSQTHTPKVHVSTGVLPPFVDPKQPPTKRSPWHQIRETPFIKSVSIVTPSSLHDQIWSRLSTSYHGTKSQPSTATSSPTSSTLIKEVPTFAKVILSLLDILSSPFYNTYIRTPGSNILLLSEGVPGVDSTYTLQDGVLRLNLSREIYERVGIQGQPVTNSGGRKHTKERFVIDLNLRAPSMIRGKKGFDRLLRAAKEVLNESKIWLFRDLHSPGPTTKSADQNVTTTEGSEDTSMDIDTHQTTTTIETTITTTNDADTNEDPHTILKHHPTTIPIEPITSAYTDILVPLTISQPQRTFAHHHRHQPPHSEVHEDYYDVLEWLDLVTLASPRVRANDSVDPYISRYAVPAAIAYTHVVPSLGSQDDPVKSRQNEAGLLREEEENNQQQHDRQDLTVLRWTAGLYDSKWLTGLLIEIIKAWRVILASNPTSTSSANTFMQGGSGTSDQWIAITVTAHQTEALGATNGYTILLQPSVFDSHVDVDTARDEEGKGEQKGAEDGDAMDVDRVGVEDQTAPSRPGTQTFICFQLVDA